MPTTWLCERAAVGGRLYLSPHLWAVAEPLAERYRTRVIVGSRLGQAWLHEVAEHVSQHPDAEPAGVTWLAPAGSVKPDWVARGVASRP